MRMVVAGGCAVWSSGFQPSATSYAWIDKEGGERGIESTYVCVRDCVGGERDSKWERGGGRIGVGEDAHWECVADQRAERETSGCTAEGKQQVSSLTPESVNGERGSRRREQRAEERGEIQSLSWEEGCDSPIPPLLVTVWTPGAVWVSLPLCFLQDLMPPRSHAAPSPHGWFVSPLATQLGWIM